MEITLVLGSNGSGKSLFAESLCVECETERFYLATMVSQNAENERRIEKHRVQRQDKGFITIEAPWDIDNIEVSSNSVVLLEDVSNLLANGLFMYHADKDTALEQILALAQKCKKLIVVSISGLTTEPIADLTSDSISDSDSDSYDEETKNYINQLNRLNEQLFVAAETVYVMVDRIPIQQK